MKMNAALRALGALGHESRLAAFRLLVQAGAGGMPVGALRERLRIPAATLSAHLNVLRAAKLVGDRREGRVIRVSANYAQMNALLAYLTENCCAGQESECAGQEPEGRQGQGRPRAASESQGWPGAAAGGRPCEIATCAPAATRRKK